MKTKFNIKFLNGFWSLFGGIILKFTKFLPIYIILFIAYGDRFLPSPLKDFSLNTRNKINQVLIGSFNEDMIKNDKYNNKRNDKIIEDINKQK